MALAPLRRRRRTTQQQPARLDQARAEIAPLVGATTYTLDRRRLIDQPGDENRTLARLNNFQALQSGQTAKCACAVNSG